jgi:hypothetical protein
VVEQHLPSKPSKSEALSSSPLPQKKKVSRSLEAAYLVGNIFLLLTCEKYSLLSFTPLFSSKIFITKINAYWPLHKNNYLLVFIIHE